MAKKFKFRTLDTASKYGKSFYQLPDSGKIMTIEDTLKRHFYQNMDTGKVFNTTSPIRMAKKRGKNKLKGVKRILRGVKYFNKKKKKFDVLPFAGKRDISKKIFKIPGAGSAKAGWLRNLPPDKKIQDGLKTRRAIHRRTTKFSGSNQFISMENLVEYASITSPKSATIGIRAAEKRLLKTYEKKLNQIARKV